VIKKQIEIVVIFTDFQMDLPADKSKPNSKLEEKFLNVIDQALLQLTLARIH
jgi:hypothetical protein